MTALAQETSETGRIILDTTEKMLAEYCQSNQLKEAEGSWLGGLWDRLAEAGLASALEPPGKGALDIPVDEALGIARVAGKFATPVPLVETLLSNWLVLDTGLPEQEGPLSIAPVNFYDRLTLEKRGEDWKLSGRAHRVPWARLVKGLVALAQCDDQYFAVLVPAEGFTVKEGENLGREPRDDVEFDALLQGASVRPYDGGMERLYVLGAALRVMQMAGALERVLDLTAGYSRERKQFGRPIAKFQAIQQNLSVLAGQVAAARAAANVVAANFGKGSAAFSVGAAKIRANEAATIAARISHQVHGAMGFTQEYELHFFTKRLWAWRDEFGSEAFWSQRLGREVCRRGADGVWGFITSGLA